MKDLKNFNHYEISQQATGRYLNVRINHEKKVCETPEADSLIQKERKKQK